MLDCQAREKATSGTVSGVARCRAMRTETTVSARTEVRAQPPQFKTVPHPSLRIEPLSGVVPRMQSDCDAYNTRTAGCFSFCAVK
jgi:hypothetical protein